MTAANAESTAGSPALLDAIERATRAGLAAVDASGRQTYVNPEFCRMVGWSAQELLGLRAPFPYWPPEAIADIDEAFRLTVSGQAPADGFQLRFMRRDGVRLDLRMLISPLLSGHDDLGWLASVVDVSEERRRDRERIDRELVAALVDNSGEGIIVADAGGTIRIFNGEAQRQHGRPGLPVHAADWATEFGLERFDGTPLQLQDTPLYRALQGQRVDDARWCVRRTDQSLRVLEGTATPMLRADGTLAGAMIITRDVTEHEHEARKLAAALDAERVARAQAERSLALFESILATAPVGFSFLDRDLRYFRINERLAKINGIVPADVIGKLQREVVPQIAQRMEPVYRRVLATGEPVLNFEMSAPTATSSAELHFDTSVYPIRDAAGQVWMVGTVVREITADRQARAEQAALHEKIKQALERERAQKAQTEADERRFRTLAESTSDIVWRTDAHGQITSDSPSWRAFTGQSLDTWLGNRGWDALHPDDRAKVAQAWAQAVHTREPFVVEYRVRRHDGVYVPMSVRGAPVVDGQGEVVEWIGANLDITERIEQQAERERLLASVQSAHAVAEAARQRMALLDRITARLVGQTDGPERVMQTLADMLVESLADWCAVHVPQADGSIALTAVAHRDPTMAAAARRHIERFPMPTDLSWGVPNVLRTGRSERIATLADGLLEDYSSDPEQLAELQRWQIGPYLVVPLTAHGQTIGALALVRSTSAPAFTAEDQALAEESGVRAGLSFEQARLLQQAQAARAEAEAASSARDEFLAMLGHELRNPLAPIVTALELLKMRSGAESVRERAILERQVRHMTRLVDDLLDVSRIVRGRIELRRERVAIADVLARAVETTGPLFEQKKHRVESRIDTALQLDGDPSRLEQIFSNVLTNAAKYTPAGGRVTVVAARRGGDIEIEVSDDGVGIDAALLPHVFDLFTQGKQTLDRAQGGLGLGLTIVRRLVEAHGGRVAARSGSDVPGTTISIVLPLADGAAAAARITAPPGASADAAAGGRVLVVDDNEDAAAMLAAALAASGFVARTASDGQAALALATQWQPDVVLLDIGLPAMDGYEVARRLREQTGAGATPLLVAVTGYGQASDVSRAHAAGFAHHLVKPVELTRLEQILRQALAPAK